ncbi:MAG: hypothetical protein HYU36_01680 [Planctomycetes bacterium]|nr:hypothetical protein [Planctomycetota bacterium]
MKTTLEIPDALFREAKVAAARLGITFRALVTKALERELEQTRVIPGPEPRWRKSFGLLHHLRNETKEIQNEIDNAFESIDKEIWK